MKSFIASYFRLPWKATGPTVQNCEYETVTCVVANAVIRRDEKADHDTARRIAACMNYCENLSIEEMESTRAARTAKAAPILEDFYAQA